MIGLFGPCSDYTADYNRISTDTPLLREALEHINPHRKERFERLSGKKLDSLMDIAYLWDTIACERASGHPLPEWTDEVYNVLLPYSNGLLRHLLYTPYMLKEKSGPLINEIRNFFLVGEERKDPMFNIYSGHDLTLLALIKAFAISDQFPEVLTYTSALAFELYTGKSIEHDVVKVKICNYSCNTILLIL